MTETPIKTCTILSVPDDKLISALRAAIEENPRNRPMQASLPGAAPGAGSLVQMAALTRKRWSPGRELRVKFMGGDPIVRERIVPFAKRWEDHANITLTFVDDDEHAEIRIAFTNTGSWTYLGTDALVIPSDEPTMNYGWLTADGSDDEYQRVVLHEFGHALSCVHEHNHPTAGIPWDLEKVYEYYELTQGWTRDDVDQQVLQKYSTSETNFSQYDEHSIMHYPVENALTLGDFEVGWNRDLSPVDMQFIATLYPPAADGPTVLTSGASVDADIGEHEEEDEYEFRLDDPSEVTVETAGSTDLVVAVFGPDDRARLAAWDDDSGVGLNSKIVRTLPAGTYRVRVRHWRSTGTGSYSIRVDVA